MEKAFKYITGVYAALTLSAVAVGRYEYLVLTAIFGVITLCLVMEGKKESKETK